MYYVLRRNYFGKADCFFFFFRFPTNLPLDSSFLGTGASSWYSKKVTKLSLGTEKIETLCLPLASPPAKRLPFAGKGPACAFGMLTNWRVQKPRTLESHCLPS